MLVIFKDEERTLLAWLREWPEAPRQRNLVEVVERLETVRKLGIGADREKRSHHARNAAIARECAIVSAQHLSHFDSGITTTTSRAKETADSPSYMYLFRLFLSLAKMFGFSLGPHGQNR